MKKISSLYIIAMVAAIPLMVSAATFERDLFFGMYDNADVKALQQFLYLVNQFCFGNRYAHDFIVCFCINKILVADNFYKLAIIDLGHQYRFKIAEYIAEISWEWAQVTNVGMAYRMAFFL